MRISNLGLTPAEVDAIMSDVTGQAAPAAATAAPPSITTSRAVLQPGQASVGNQPAVSPIKTSTPTPVAPPVRIQEAGPGLAPPKPAAPAPKSAFAPVLTAATAGMVFGGPVGAVVGAGAGWLFTKLR